MNNKKVYFGEKVEFILQQEVGLQKLISTLRKDYVVRELKDIDDGEILLVEEKDQLK